MSTLDWAVLSTYFLMMIVVGLWARTKIKVASDFFTAGGTMPWWLSGISHHMSGYSAAVFVGFAAIAYSSGINIYIWWAGSISLALLIGSNIFPPRWSRLRQRLGVISPLEYLLIRYDLPTQQLLAWSGAVLKIFDVAAKWTAAAILLQVFAAVPTIWGVLLIGGVTIVYSVVGGLWADALTDLSQFLIQIVAGVVMLIAVCSHLGGVSALWTVWHRLPPSHSSPFTGQYTLAFALIYFLVNMSSYNGGTWSLAQRFIATPTGDAARKAALLSSALYLVWPLVLFFPMWAAPLLLPHLADPSQSYALLVDHLLPHGLVGLVLAGLFAHTMAMTSSDANATAAVVVRDILPVLRNGKSSSDKSQLLTGRICTFTFLTLSMILALAANNFGGVIGLMILWYGALVGPIAIPMLLGMVGIFRRSGPTAAISSWTAGAIAFGLTRYVFAASIGQNLPSLRMTFSVGAPILVSLVTYIAVAFIWPSTNEASNRLLRTIAND